MTKIRTSDTGVGSTYLFNIFQGEWAPYLELGLKISKPFFLTRYVSWWKVKNKVGV